MYGGLAFAGQCLLTQTSFSYDCPVQQDVVLYAISVRSERTLLLCARRVSSRMRDGRFCDSDGFQGRMWIWRTTFRVPEPKDRPVRTPTENAQENLFCEVTDSYHFRGQKCSVTFSFSRFIYPALVAFIISSLTFPPGYGQFIVGMVRAVVRIGEPVAIPLSFRWAQNRR